MVDAAGNGKKMFDKAADAVKDQGKNILSGQASLLQLISDFVMLLVLMLFICMVLTGYPLLLFQGPGINHDSEVLDVAKPFSALKLS
ncbi:hypothetical protein Tco_0337233 [Tanacetum coccineum]